jgi:hypothetical protein
MSDRDGYEPGVPCWVATIEPDPEAAAAFYGELFGWDCEDGGGSWLRVSGAGTSRRWPRYRPAGTHRRLRTGSRTYGLVLTMPPRKHEAPAAPYWRNPSRDPPAA